MDCLLIRHGIAIEPNEWDGEEAQRPLTAKGRTRTKQVAQGLAVLEIVPAVILTSPYARAHETAEILQRTLDAKASIRVCEELTPGSQPEQVLELLATLPEDACVVCVGHEPLLSSVAGLMLAGRSLSGLEFGKAGACLIRFSEAPKQGEGRLDWWMRPSQLRAMRRA